MTKTLTALIVAVFATVAFNAQAASHVKGAPMKASEPAAGASAPMKKKAHRAKAAKPAMKKASEAK
jgi:hypothetical protein